jgi:D-arabinose 1-dehydrogenase-like Zn-dependent alcohol dehydrogenase
VQEWDHATPGPDEVRVEIGAAALCRSDMSLYNGNPLVGSKPAGEVVPGHEPAGTIVEIGETVDYLSEGDRVAINCFAGCGHCEYCRRGEPNLCPDVEILGFDRHGGDAEEVVTPASTCHLMPDKMSMATGAISTDALGNLYIHLDTISSIVQSRTDGNTSDESDPDAGVS